MKTFKALTEGLVREDKQTVHTIHGTAKTYDPKKESWAVDQATYKIKGSVFTLTALKHGLKKLKDQFPHHKEHEVSLKESEQLDEISQGLATKVYKARVGKMARALKKGDEATAEKHFNKSQQTADRMSNKPSFDVKKGIRDLSEESEQLDEISKSLSLAVGKKRLEQGKHFQNAVSKWGLNLKHSKMYAKKADEYFGKSKKAYEYAFNKGVTKGKELEESAWDTYRRQALDESYGEKGLVSSTHPAGTKVLIPHNGKMVKGKIVRYDKGEQHGSPFYVVDHGAYESKKVPLHNIRLNEGSDLPFHKYTNDELDAAIKHHADSATELRRFDRKSHAAYQHIQHAHAAREILKSRKRNLRNYGMDESVTLDEASLNVKTLSAEEIAQKHGVSLDTIKDQIAKGIRVEHEHTTSDQTAEEIARDHLGERPDYYEKLDKANLEEADLKAQWNTDFRKDSYARRKNLSRTIKQQLNPKTPGLGNKAWKRADKEERENRKSTVSASLHESATTSTSGMSFKEAIAHATKHGGKIVFGTNSQKWHSISPEDRDYNMPHASDPQDAQKVGEKQAMWGVRSVAKSIVNRKPPKWRTLTNPMQTVTELHDEPDRPGTGIGVSGDGTEKGMAMTEDGPSKKKTISKADWDHHTRHATAQFDTDGQRWIVQQDATGAAVRIPVTVTEDYPYRQTIRRILREAFPMAPKSTEKPDNTQDDEEKGEAPKVKKEKVVDPVVIGKTKDKFEADPVLTPVLSVANMPGGSVR